MSRMFAFCPATGTSARVVVATLLETIESFAYGVEVAPIATLSVEVESATEPTLFVVQPPPLEAPPVAIVPQPILPEASVCSASPPPQERIEFMLNVLACAAARYE